MPKCSCFVAQHVGWTLLVQSSARPTCHSRHVTRQFSSHSFSLKLLMNSFSPKHAHHNFFESLSLLLLMKTFIRNYCYYWNLFFNSRNFGSFFSKYEKTKTLLSSFLIIKKYNLYTVITFLIRYLKWTCLMWISQVSTLFYFNFFCASSEVTSKNLTPTLLW